MQVSEVPTSRLKKEVQCNYCTFKFPINQICAFNKITDLSQMRFAGWTYEETKDEKVYNDWRDPWLCGECKN